MKYLDLAIKIAKAGSENRNYLIGCVGLRTDGAIVTSYNLWTKRPQHEAHAEFRVINKSDKGTTIWVSRVLRDGTWACAKPCVKCQSLIRNKGIKRVYYTTGPQTYSCWTVI